MRNVHWVAYCLLHRTTLPACTVFSSPALIRCSGTPTCCRFACYRRFWFRRHHTCHASPFLPLPPPVLHRSMMGRADFCTAPLGAVVLRFAFFLGHYCYHLYCLGYRLYNILRSGGLDDVNLPGTVRCYTFAPYRCLPACYCCLVGFHYYRNGVTAHCCAATTPLLPFSFCYMG